VDVQGQHGLQCKQAPNRIVRHNVMNDSIVRSLSSAGISASKEPTGLTRLDGKCPDGLTVVPWQGGKHMSWDITVAMYAYSVLPPCFRSFCCWPSIRVSQEFFLVPIAVETLGEIAPCSLDFLTEVGRRLSAATGDARETAFLFQRISVAI